MSDYSEISALATRISKDAHHVYMTGERTPATIQTRAAVLDDARTLMEALGYRAIRMEVVTNSLPSFGGLFRDDKADMNRDLELEGAIRDRA